MLWNFKRISQYQWCIPLGISVSYIGRGSPSIPIVLFFTILKVLVYALQNEFFLRFDYSFFHLPMLSFVFMNKQIKTPPKKQKTKYQRDVHKFKGEKIMFPNREKDRWKRKKIYLKVLRLRSWSVSMRSLNPWWTVRRSRECGDEAAAAAAKVWIVDGMEWSQWRVGTWD